MIRSFTLKLQVKYPVFLASAFPLGTEERLMMYVVFGPAPRVPRQAHSGYPAVWSSGLAASHTPASIHSM